MHNLSFQNFVDGMSKTQNHCSCKNNVQVGILRTLAPEVFFNPQLPENGGDASQSLQAVIASLLNDVDASRREYLCQHIILCGGSSAH
jgi:hypothetical protein